MYLYVNLYYPKMSKQNIENFYDWRIFTFATGVNDTGAVVHLEQRISPQNFRKKSKMVLMGYSGAWEKLINKKHEVENLMALSF